MANAIDGLKPALVWKYFAEISRIPRGSKNETAIATYLVNTAKTLGLEASQDGAGNVVARKPASAGREKVASVCLQGHMDMVCEKNKETVHDFLKDPLKLVRNDNFMMASGTTLGADNGIAVATCLAIMEDKTLKHGPLEFLFTVDEETGLTGANNLQPGFLRSMILLNLDSEDEGELYVGCSGGRDNTGTWAAAWDDAPAGGAGLLVTVKGLKGGHSGLEIHTGRGNALKIMTRVLIGLGTFGARVARVEGGNKRNAIPREAESVITLPKAKAADAAAYVAKMNETIAAELATVEPNLVIACQAQKGVRKVLKKALQKKVLLTLAGLPHGVLKMSADIVGLVETSTNLAIIETGKKEITIQTSQRSSVASEIDEACPDGTGGVRVGRRSGHGLGRVSGLEAEHGVANPQAGAVHLHRDVREGAAHQGGARGPRVRNHRREIPGDGHGVVRSDDARGAFTERAPLHRHGREVLRVPARNPAEREVGGVVVGPAT